MQRTHPPKRTRTKHNHNRRRTRNTIQQLPQTPRRNARKRSRNKTPQPPRPKSQPPSTRTQLHLPSPKSKRQNTHPLHRQRQQAFPNITTRTTRNPPTIPMRYVHRRQGATGTNPPPTPQQPQQDTTASLPPLMRGKPPKSHFTQLTRKDPSRNQSMFPHPSSSRQQGEYSHAGQAEPPKDQPHLPNHAK